jgi:hypothetical protein
MSQPGPFAIDAFWFACAVGAIILIINLIGE